MKSIMLISWFDKKTENLVGEFEFPKISSDEFRKILKLEYSKENPKVLGEFVLLEENLELLKNYIDLKFDFDKYDYFIGRCSIE